jgi:hypothetical protein
MKKEKDALSSLEEMLRIIGPFLPKPVLEPPPEKREWKLSEEIRRPGQWS